jgi:molybdopterin converting factor small subunit
VPKFLKNELGVPPDEVKIVFVNGVSRRFDHVLADGDRVGIFSPVGGG